MRTKGEKRERGEYGTDWDIASDIWKQLLMHAGINTVNSIALYSTHMNAQRLSLTLTHLHTLQFLAG